MTSTNTLTLVEGLTRIADAAKRPDGTDSPLSEELRSAITALEAAQKALEPFAEKANWMDDLLGRVTTGDFDPTVATVSVSDLRLARTVYSMLMGNENER